MQENENSKAIQGIKKDIWESKLRYQDIIIENPPEDYLENLHKKAFIWKASKEGCGDIYLLGTLHKSNKNLF